MKKIITISLLFCYLLSSGQKGFSILVDDTLKFQTKITSSFQKDSASGRTYGSVYIEVETGTLNANTLTNYDFHLLNNDDDPLIITQAWWGEPNFSPTYNKNEPIKKGQSGLLRYTCHTLDRIGQFEKVARVETDFGQIMIRFKGNTIPASMGLDKRFKLETITLGNKIKAEFKIYNKADSALKIDSIIIDQYTSLIPEKDKLASDSIAPHFYHTFKIEYTPDKIGDLTSKVIVMVSGRKTEFDIYATVKKKASHPADKCVCPAYK